MLHTIRTWRSCWSSFPLVVIITNFYAGKWLRRRNRGTGVIGQHGFIPAKLLSGAINLFNISQRGKAKQYFLLPTAADLGFFFSLCKAEVYI